MVAVHSVFVIHVVSLLTKCHRVGRSRCVRNVVRSPVVVLDVVGHVASLYDDVPSVHVPDPICRYVSHFNIVVAVDEPLTRYVNVHPATDRMLGNLGNLASIDVKKERHLGV